MTELLQRNSKLNPTLEPRRNYEVECRKATESSKLPQSPRTRTTEEQFKETKENFYTKCGSTMTVIQQTLTNSRPHAEGIIQAAGFSYIKNTNDSVQCAQCNLKLSGITKEMIPFQEHKIQSPSCPFVKKMTRSDESDEMTTSPAISSIDGKPQKLQKTESMTCVGDTTTKQNINKRKQQNVTCNFVEMACMHDIRKRTFSHWPHKNPSKSQIIEAGFFMCNVGDRVICIYCNIICQQWTPYSDDPTEIHKLLSPNCPYVKSILQKNTSKNIIPIVNETEHQSSQNVSMSDTSKRVTNVTGNNIRSNEFVLTAACNQQYIELHKRATSFATWPTDSLPSVEDLVKSGFYYTGMKTIVTCFYCNGSLQNWGAKDNPMIEHARWFPYCAYARQLCGDDLYRKIQESKRAAQERIRSNEQQQTKSFSISNINETSNNNLPLTNSGIISNSRQLQIPDEDQLRLKHDDFASDSDLLLACTILQKQIHHIDGKKENIIIPSVHMKKLAEQVEKERAERENVEQHTLFSNPTQTTSLPMISSLSSSSTSEDAEMTSVINESATSDYWTSSTESDLDVKSTDEKSKPKSNSQTEVTNPCVLCLTDEKRLACIPCGHLATCVPCGHSLRTCPICRREIEAFVRVYI
ncbi:unnamed protein product [Didymodactylos carnosus]|uniref:RING-type domain-containing protein n=1 Tax=Didymodactylos carnosus TaxID=1234261 RepID=A0A8S2GZI8_9BILA|nr:unnamed protein product [Didymodactylos carnosus]CAF3558066.1 unnamed protein product [Didymodactylos carnosus]